MKTAFASVALGAMIFTGCGSNTTTSPPVTIKSKDGKLQITAPPGWIAATDLNDEAVIQAKNGGKDLFCIVMADSRSDEAGTFGEYVQGRLDSLTKTLTDVNVSDQQKVQAGVGDAYQNEIQGTFSGADKVKIVYILTTLQTKTYWASVLAWTTPSHFDANKDELSKLAATVSEVQQP